MQEQEYSLNPGRYVGVVIEEDGKTEEEFIAEILQLTESVETMNVNARTLEKLIRANVKELVGE